MSDWLTYGLSDFLLFSPRTYYRLFELYHRCIWPLQLSALVAVFATLLLLKRGGPRPSKGISLLLAICWVWVAWAFLYSRYATINWAAPYAALAFAIEALVLVWLGVLRRGLTYTLHRNWRGMIGLALFLFAAAVQPITGILTDREWSQIEIFAFTPDPTAVGTCGLLLLSDNRLRFAAMVVPIAWCVVSSLTLFALHSWDAAVLSATALLALVAAFGRPR